MENFPVKSSPNPSQNPAGNVAVRERRIYSVSRLNQEVQKLLESGFGTLWLEGELSNFSRPASGHFYFTLKDSRSQIRCAMFKGRNRTIDFEPGNGDAVLVRGKLGLYSARGDFQLIVEQMEPAGAGRLQAAFEATKRKLDALGWFSTDAKQPLPAMPQSIGVVTSPTGAALRDVLQVLSRRYRQASIIIYPTPTQGATAAPGICAALKVANTRKETDVLLLVRGGGSMEDLWAFNEVSVAQSIRDSEIPVVTGVGHEIDVTISDLVSDLRGPTPSAAAELATPDSSSLSHHLSQANKQLQRAQQRLMDGLQLQLKDRITRLYRRHPERTLREQAQRVDDIDLRLHRQWQQQHHARKSRWQQLQARLKAQSPVRRLQRDRANLHVLEHRLQNAMHAQHGNCATRFQLLARALNSVSPLAVLDRGFALVKKDNQLILNAADLLPGDEIDTRLANGEFSAIVSATKPIAK